MERFLPMFVNCDYAHNDVGQKIPRFGEYRFGELGEVVEIADVAEIAS